MLLLPQGKLFLGSRSNIFMGSKNFLLLKFSATPAAYARIRLLDPSCPCSSQIGFFHSSSRKSQILFASPKLLSPIYQRSSGYSYRPSAVMAIPRPSKFSSFSCYVLFFFFLWVRWIDNFLLCNVKSKNLFGRQKHQVIYIIVYPHFPTCALNKYYFVLIL